MKDYYASLELNFGASQSEIKASYRRLAKVYHPDLHFGNRVYEEKFKEINEAYSVLNNEELKNKYDLNYLNNIRYKSSKKSEQSANSSKDEKQSQKQEPKNANRQNTNNMIDNILIFLKTKSKKELYRYGAVFAVIIITIYIFTKDSISNHFDEIEKKANYELMIAKIEKSQNFDDIAMLSLDIPKVSLETKWKNGLMYYKFSINSVGDSIKIGEKTIAPLKTIDSVSGVNYFKIKVNTVRQFNLDFLDKEGFKVYSLAISLDEMTQIVDNDGVVVGYTVNSNIKIKPELYYDFAKWDITYYNN